ncbi:MAG: hypothetical protein EAZ92_07440 [Candidatus Kapaibacterium sp.]|nr:MAG: hypothetical protein EAZ92_07440 [Candidatus Kapabacteria bacterium]
MVLKTSMYQCWRLFYCCTVAHFFSALMPCGTLLFIYQQAVSNSTIISLLSVKTPKKLHENS